MKKISFKKLKKLSKKKKIIMSAIAVVLVGAIVGGVVLGTRGSNTTLPQTTVQTATVTTGSISNTIVGTGNLEADDSDSITVPSGITIKKVKVESGDEVSKGDTLATVDKTSVLSAMESVQEQIDSLDEDISDCKNGDETETVTAKISGTVKKIYVKTGGSVTDCIIENGALLILQDSDSGEKMEITASGGTVSKIHVSKGDKVSEGDTLFTITMDEESVGYKQLIAQRKELVASLKKLTEMAQTGKIVADIDGTVGSVNVSEGSESSGSSGNSSSGNSSGGGMSATQMSYTTGSVSAQTLSTSSKKTTATTLSTSSKKTTATTLSTVSAATTQTESNNTNAGVAPNEGENPGGFHDGEKIKLKIIGTGTGTKNNLVISSPKTGENPQSEIKVSDGSYEGKISWKPADSTFKGETTYSAEVALNAKDGYAFSADSISSVETGILSGVSVSDDGKTMTFKITFPATQSQETQQGPNAKQEEITADSQENKQETVQNQNNQILENNQSGNAQENNNESGASNNSAAAVSGNTSVSGSASISGTASGSDSQSGQTSDDSDSATSSYSSSEVTAFTIASNDTMLLSVNVDELDINSVSKGQEASVTLDAIEGETFTGTVTKVSNSAESSGNGVAKYTVKIIIPKDEQMKEGMNASATIVIENKDDILTIPVNALQEKGDQVFVYTKQDSDGNLSGETDVTTGLSDGDNVEITEGLSEGDTVYYQKTGNTSSQSMGGGMPGGNDQGGFGGGGNMPDMNGGGGGMPSGGGPGQGGN